MVNSKDINIPFCNGNFWIEIERDRKWIELTLRQIYTPDIEAQRVLGKTDARPLLVIGFHVP